MPLSAPDPSTIPPTIQTLFSSSATKTVSATTAETSIIGTGIGSLSIAANSFKVGKSLRFAIRGLYSTPALNLGTVTIRIKLGNTTIASGVASSLVALASNLGFDGECVITCRSIGSSGTVIIMGGVTYGVGANLAPYSVAINNGTSPSTIDTTSALAFDVTVQWSNNTNGNTVSSLNCLLEVLN